MPHDTLASAAQPDIRLILAWTHEHFGEAARARYKKLLKQAILDVARDRDLPGSIKRPELGKDICTYRIFHSRTHVPAKERVRHPRHFLVYYKTDEVNVTIVRVLHDSMDLSRHIH